MSGPAQVVALRPERPRRRAERHAQVTFFTLTSPEMMEVSNAARLLYVILTTYVNYETGEGWVSWGMLARALRTSRSRVRALAAELVEARLVERFSRGRTERGEDEECGWRLIAPGSPGGRDDRREEGSAEEHTCARRQAPPCPPAGTDRDPDPASPSPDRKHTVGVAGLSDEADGLVREFHGARGEAAPARHKHPIQHPDRPRPLIPVPDPPEGTTNVAGAATQLVIEFHAARGAGGTKPLRSEMALAAELIREHGQRGARAIVQYGLAKIQASWPGAATFGAIRPFVARANTAGVAARVANDGASGEESRGEGLDRTQDPPAPCMQRLVELWGETVVHGMATDEPWQCAETTGALAEFLNPGAPGGRPTVASRDGCERSAGRERGTRE